jgi:hypothetical protein
MRLLGNDMFSMMPQAKCKVIKNNGSYFEMTAGYSKNDFYVTETDIKPNIIEYDDIIEATYANDSKVSYKVTEPGYMNVPQLPPHYQIKTERIENNTQKSNIPNVNNNGNGNIIVNVGSPNSNITLNQDLSIFDNIKQAIEKESIQNRSEILAKLEELRLCVNDKKTFGQKYAEFVAICANHMSLIQPFLGCLSSFL